MHAVHGADLVHRDVKPHNVLLDEEGQVKLTDFGLAVAASGQTGASTAVIGTPDYMAPEQLETTRQDLDARCDVYALGAVLLVILLLSLHNMDLRMPLIWAFAMMLQCGPVGGLIGVALGAGLCALITFGAQAAGQDIVIPVSGTGVVLGLGFAIIVGFLLSS